VDFPGKLLADAGADSLGFPMKRNRLDRAQGSEEQYTRKIRIRFSARAVEGDDDFDRPPLNPSRGEGRKCRRANDLFPLPTGGARGWAIR
jgi:hypothetical protein